MPASHRLPTLPNRQTDSYLSGLSLLSFRHILQKENIFLFTAKVHVFLSKFGDRLPEKENQKEKETSQPYVIDACYRPLAGRCCRWVCSRMSLL